MLELQFLLDQLGDDSVRQDLKRPDATGSPLLTDADLTSLDEFYKLVGPDRNYDVRFVSRRLPFTMQQIFFYVQVIYKGSIRIKKVKLFVLPIMTFAG